MTPEPRLTSEHLRASVQGTLDEFLAEQAQILAGISPDLVPFTAWLGELLAGRDRRLAAPTFAPDGLHFTGAEYDAGWELPPTCRPVVLPLA